MKIDNAIIYILLIIGILVSGNLLINEMINEGVCPKIGTIPACYFVFASFAIPFVLHLFKMWNIVFFLFIGAAFSLAIIASLGQIMGRIECPKTDLGIPKCYISFVLLLVILFFKDRMIKRMKI